MDGSAQLHAESGAPRGRDTAQGRLIVGIATTGRADILTPTVRALAAQTRRPDLVVLSIAEARDVAATLPAEVPFDVAVIEGPKGSSAQRNRVLEMLAPDDIVLFLDDDFLMASDYLERLDALFAAHTDVAMFTGTVLADGVVGRGLSHEEGIARLAADARHAPAEPSDAIEDTWNGYGCNFAVRGSVVTAHALRFDEKLPLYGWLEDVDFSGLAEPHGRICRADALRGVHLGVKVARSPGRRLGYSQIANPVYLLRKKTIRRAHARELMLRNLASNLVYSVKPRPWTDSRGRLVGNLIALTDWARGRIHPERIRDL
ncbi:MAG: glycosyltransferase [Pseudomonadota bacterium]